MSHCRSPPKKKSISRCSAVLTQLTSVTDRQTIAETYTTLPRLYAVRRASKTLVNSARGTMLYPGSDLSVVVSNRVDGVVGLGRRCTFST